MRRPPEGRPRHLAQGAQGGEGNYFAFRVVFFATFFAAGFFAAVFFVAVFFLGAICSLR